MLLLRSHRASAAGAVATSDSLSASLRSLLGLQPAAGSGGDGSAGQADGPHAGADTIDAVTADELAKINADPHSALPVVNKERPNLPRVLADTGKRVWAAVQVQAKKRQQQPQQPSALPSGTTYVAVLVCGPHEMIAESLRVCHEWNAGPMGRHVTFHVHHETFMF